MKEKKKRRVVNYVNNRTLHEHLQVYRAAFLKTQERGERRPQIPNYIGECIMLIANKIASKRCYRNYSFLEEMISDGIENVVMYIHTFDPEKSSNPFAYLSITIERTFHRRIASERKQQYILLKSSQKYMINDQLMPDQVLGEPIELYDNLQEFIVDYEAKNGIITPSSRKKKDQKPVVNQMEFWA